MSEPEPFICQQLPIAALSAECYKERKAGSGQTLTGLGKWWGRKPLILVRATLLGLLMPSSGNLAKDRRIFLKILTMDEAGIRQRLKRPRDWEAVKEKPYPEQIKNAYRPEEIDGPDEESWQEINEHLGTIATTLPELFEQLSIRRFGQRATVGDCFCGGGSIPFEAARLGLDAFASDLNPIACLLTWGALNIVGGGPEKVKEVREDQEKVYAEVERQIEEWGIERSEEGWRAEYYLYCVEVRLPDGWKVPLAPSWVIGKKTNTVALLRPDYDQKCFNFEVVMGASEREMNRAEEGTIQNGYVRNPATNQSVKLAVLRNDRREVVGADESGKKVKETCNDLRQWEAGDWKPRPDDFYQERLYCIRWRDHEGKTVYREPTPFDLQTEKRVEELLGELQHQWQQEGHIPSMRIEPGAKTSEPIRTRGWNYWHQLFNPRQLIINGLYSFGIQKDNLSFLLKVSDFNCKACGWIHQNEQLGHLFANNAVNTLYNFCSRTSSGIHSLLNKKHSRIEDVLLDIKYQDSLSFSVDTHLFITDPPYADAINYDELSEFFISWIEKKLPRDFPNWEPFSKRALSIRGSNDEKFEDLLTASYDNLRRHTLPGGLQVVMFTHSSNEVWLSLNRVIRRSGLQVLAIWAVRTETENASKGDGNYVKATYLIVLRDRTAHAPKPKFQIRGEVVKDVDRLLTDMQSLNQDGELNFKFGDLLLAAPTALLRVMTSYDEIRGLNALDRDKFEKDMLAAAEKHRDERLYPEGFDGPSWEGLARGERFYLMGIEQEERGDRSQELYQLSSKAYGITDYRPLLASTKANEARLMTPLEINGRRKLLETIGEDTYTAALLGAVAQAEKEATANAAHRHLKDLFNPLTPESAAHLRRIARFLAARKNNLPHWKQSSEWLEEIEVGIGQF